MNISTLCSLLGVSLILVNLGFTAEKSAVKTRDQMIQEGNQRQALQKKEFEAQKIEAAKTQAVERPEFIKPKIEKTYLYSRGVWTYVPKTSILYIPKSLERNIVQRPRGKVVSWQDFIKHNRSIIHLHPVTIEQVRAQEKIKQEVIRGYKSTAKIVIATYHKGLITVNPKALEPENTELSKQ